jgi:hypothetical protein
MRSGQEQIGEPPRKDDPEKTRVRKKKGVSLVNADPKLIDDLIRIEGLRLATLHRRLIELSEVFAPNRRLRRGEGEMRCDFSSLR